MKTIKIIIAALTASVVWVACSEKSNMEDALLQVSPETISISQEGGSASFTITCSSSWTITYDNPDMQVSPTSGTGNATINVTVTKNLSPTENVTRLVVRASGGAVRNVTVTQSGLLIDGSILNVTNHANMLSFGGKAGMKDSLQIHSNVPWKLYGPDWIEASMNGTNWTTLSSTRAMLSGGSYSTGAKAQKVLLRTKTQNDDIYDRNDILSLQQDYDDGEPYELEVMQLGAYHVAPHITVPMASSLATDWKCGAKVTTFYCKLVDHLLSDNESSPDQFTNWNEYTPTLICSWFSLKEETEYYLYTVGKDEQGNTPLITGVGFMTGTSKDQPIAEIVDVTCNGNEWRLNYKMNSFCKAYYRYYTVNTARFSYNDAFLAWYINRDLHDDTQSQDYLGYTSDGYTELVTEKPFMAVTWGLGNDGTKLSDVLSRFVSTDFNAAPLRQQMSGDVEIQEQSASYEELKNSFIRIK